MRISLLLLFRALSGLTAKASLESSHDALGMLPSSLYARANGTIRNARQKVAVLPPRS